MERERRIFTEATRGANPEIPAHVINSAQDSALRRFFAACDSAREKAGLVEYEARLETEGPGYARYLFVEELAQACYDHKLFLAKVVS